MTNLENGDKSSKENKALSYQKYLTLKHSPEFPFKICLLWL